MENKELDMQTKANHNHIFEMGKLTSIGHFSSIIVLTINKTVKKKKP